MGRFTEETAPNVKNRSHTITARIAVPAGGADGVLVAQGGRFGGWSLYVVDGYPSYAYNCYGRDLYSVRSTEQLAPGAHEVRVEFHYDGGGLGKGGRVRLVVDGQQIGAGRVEQTAAYYFSFDETLNIGVDRGTPVTDDYLPVHNAFTGTLAEVRIDLGDDDHSASDTPEDRQRRLLGHQ
jgi:arylsulfatase